MDTPSLKEAEEFLLEAEKLNPGPWVAHSRNVAKAAKIISEKTPSLIPDIAYAFGILHDIGRREGKFFMKHTIDGYKFLKEKGFDIAAKICMTHSFAIKDLRCYVGKNDCSPEDTAFLKKYLLNIEYDDYDRLIQLCDALALPEGFCLLEKRFLDVALRHKINGFVLNKWKFTIKLKKEFENKIGKSIYSLLPEVTETTFNCDLV